MSVWVTQSGMKNGGVMSVLLERGKKPKNVKERFQQGEHLRLMNSHLDIHANLGLLGSKKNEVIWRVNYMSTWFLSLWKNWVFWDEKWGSYGQNTVLVGKGGWIGLRKNFMIWGIQC